MSSGHFWRAAFLAVTSVIVAAVGVTAGAYLRFAQGGKIAGRYAVPFMRPAFGGKPQITLLVLGLDVKDKLNPRDGQRTDSMMLLRIDLAHRKVLGLSIPRDTLAEIPGRVRKDKINSAFTLGGVDSSIAAVERLTDVHPDYYAVSDVSGFKKIVDLIGGIDLDVEKNMDYDDDWQDLHIHLRRGFQRLDGEHAMEYVRFRHDRFGDITRMQRQQRFLRALAQRMMAISNLPKLPRALAEMRDAVHTNIETSDLAYLASTLRSATGENIKMSTMPGEPRMIHGISYMVPDQGKTRALVASLFDVRNAGGPATVEVLNGSGRRGIAASLARRIAGSGYKIVRVGNADRGNYDTSEVVYHADHQDGADDIVSLLGTGRAAAADPAADVSSGADVPVERRSRPSDITVIVGRDYAAQATQ